MFAYVNTVCVLRVITENLILQQKVSLFLHRVDTAPYSML